MIDILQQDSNGMSVGKKCLHRFTTVLLVFYDTTHAVVSVLLVVTTTKLVVNSLYWNFFGDRWLVCGFGMMGFTLNGL